MTQRGVSPCIVCKKPVNKDPGRICDTCGDPNQIRMVCGTCGKVEFWNKEIVARLRKNLVENGYTVEIPDRNGIVIRFNACCVPGLPARLTVFELRDKPN